MQNRNLTDYLYQAFSSAAHIMLEKWLAEDVEIDRSFAKVAVQDHYPVIQGWDNDTPWTNKIPVVASHGLFDSAKWQETFQLLQKANGQMDDPKITRQQEGAAFVLNMFSVACEEQQEPSAPGL